MDTPLSIDLGTRTCVVTGANAGIGKEVARSLARMGARVVLACRSEKRGSAALEEIAQSTGSRSLELLLLDLSSQASIRAFADELCKRHERLHVLVNNAAIWPDTRELSADGIEMTWATNVLGPFLLTKLLLENLRRAGKARIVNVASDFAGGLELEDVQFERRGFTGTAAYRQSKQADRMLSWALAERLVGSGVTVNACHPGSVDTQLLRYQSGLFGLAVTAYNKVLGKSPATGADTPVWLAASPELDDVSGKYWSDRKERPRKFHEPLAEARLWELCESMVA